MKHLLLKPLLLIPLMIFAVGCSYEKESRYCPLDPEEDNVILDFELKDADANDIFEENIDLLEVFVFDQNGLFHSRQPLTQAELTSFRGAIFRLRAGTYSFVVWANHGGNSAIDPMEVGVTHYSDLCLSHSCTDNCDPLFYGPMAGHSRSTGYTASEPMEIQVPSSGTVRTTFPLQYAYKKVHLFVKDFRDNGVPALPELEITGVWRGYDFRMNPLKDTPLVLSQSSELVETPEGDMAHAAFIITSFDTDNTITLHLKNASGASDYPVVLNDYLDLFPIDLEVEVVIPIIVNYLMDGSVEITRPSWDEEGIRPKPLG